ncbi:ferrochelatase [Actinobaculum suis]|uniref:Coproporphyrin III ferrochelatase n=1 Tax=Actinobaculum suis TaxID=1657 RepID=A0A7Z9C8S1_9ACTO|nr:ferrochelatase [Actinobaculum suis]VDG75478.1 ferrochelatase [Actinobaculum suis]
MADAYMILSYGGPDKTEDVIPFLRNATKGRNIPDARLAMVGKHYELFGGKSPINELNEKLAADLRAELASRGDHTPIFIGNRNWKPFGNTVLQEMYTQGIREVLALATSAYASYSSCRQYREDAARWLGEISAPGMHIRKIKPFWDQEFFYQAQLAVTRQALAELPEGRLVFVTHSIPTAMEEASATAQPYSYNEQHLQLARRLTAELGVQEWDLVYCSRSGSPHTPWLEPDICDHIADLAARGIRDVIAVPFGFIYDHMEVVYDLDTEAKEAAAEHGVRYLRAATVGDQPGFISGLADLLTNPGDMRYRPDDCLPGTGELLPAIGEEADDAARADSADSAREAPTA